MELGVGAMTERIRDHKIMYLESCIKKLTMEINELQTIINSLTGHDKLCCDIYNMFVYLQKNNKTDEIKRLAKQMTEVIENASDEKKQKLNKIFCRIYFESTDTVISNIFYYHWLATI